MVNPANVEQLGKFDGQGARVLSVYLDLDPGGQVRRTYRVVFEDLVKETGARLTQEAREAFDAEAARVQSWLETEPLKGKGLVLFSCAPRDLWQVFTLQVRVEHHLAFEPDPDLAPLLELLDDHERYAVALVDKRHARLFTVFMGEIEEADEFEDYLFRASMTRGASRRPATSVIMRHMCTGISSGSCSTCRSSFSGDRSID